MSVACHVAGGCTPGVTLEFVWSEVAHVDLVLLTGEWLRFVCMWPQ